LIISKALRYNATQYNTTRKTNMRSKADRSCQGLVKCDGTRFARRQSNDSWCRQASAPNFIYRSTAVQFWKESKYTRDL